MTKKIDSKGINSKRFYTEQNSLTRYLRLDSCRTANGKSFWLGKKVKRNRISLSIIATIIFVIGFIYTII